MPTRRQMGDVLTSPRLSVNLGHFRPPPSGTAHMARFTWFVSPYSTAFMVACGPSPTGTDGCMAVGSDPSGSSMATCVSRVKRTENVTVVCVQ